MSKSKWIWIGLSILFTVGALYGLSQMGKTRSPGWEVRNEAGQALRTQQEKLSKEIKTLAGENYCRVDADCQIAGMGAKLCDGFNQFLIYSVYGSYDGKRKLVSTVKRFNTIASKLNDISFKVKKCGIKAPPVRCVQKRCLQIQVEKN